MTCKYKYIWLKSQCGTIQLLLLRLKIPGETGRRRKRKEGVGALALPLAWSAIGVWREKVVSWLFLGDSHLHTLPIVQWWLSLELRKALLGRRRLLWEQHQVTRGEDHSGYEWLALERINDWVGVVRCVCLNWVLVISKASFIENIVFIQQISDTVSPLVSSQIKHKTLNRII